MLCVDLTDQAISKSFEANTLGLHESGSRLIVHCVYEKALRLSAILIIHKQS